MWGSLDASMPESWPEDPATKAWKDAEALAALQAQERAKTRTWGETWNDVKGIPGRIGGFLTGSSAAPAPANTPSGIWGRLNPMDEVASMPTSNPIATLGAGAAEAVASGVTAPGDALSGKLPMVGPEGNTSLEAVRRAFDTASLAGGGAVGGAASRAVPQLAADAAKSGAPLAAAGHMPGFYSALDQAVAGAKTARAPGAQWEATLRNAGVKPEEMDWRGLTQMLQERRGQPITRDELTAHLQANPPPEIKPIDKRVASWDRLTPEEQYRIADEYQDNPYARREYSGPREWFENSGDLQEKAGGPRYQDYVLPGAENYRERLLTMPGEEPRFAIYRGDEKLSSMDFATAKEARDYARKAGGFEGATVRQTNDTPQAYKSSHWDEPNILAHRRSSDREFPVAFTPEEQAAIARRQEIDDQLAAIRREQGDVGRTIRMTSQQMEADRLARLDDDLRAGRISPADYRRAAEEYVDSPELRVHQDRLQALRAQEDQLRAAMPEEVTPKSTRSLHAEEIQSDWHQEGRKNGYLDNTAPTPEERVALTAEKNQLARDTANMQPNTPEYRQAVARATEIDQRLVGRVPDGPFKKTWHELAAKDMLHEAVQGDYPRISWTAGGSHPTNPKNLNFDGGAPNAERAAAYEAADRGMRGFYDKMIPDYLNKLGKKYGVKVERSSLDGKYDVFYMDIPEAMRNDIRSKGFALFEDSSPGQAVATAGALNERSAAQAGLDVRGGLERAAGGEPGVAAAQAAAARHAGAIQPLEGLPSKPLSVGGQPYVPGPIEAVHNIAKDYMASTGRPYVRQERYIPVDEAKAKAIAQAYEEMPHAPNDPKVKAAYKAMIDETVAQYDAAVKSGIKFEPIPAGMPDPYAETPRLAAKDVQENNHLWYFPTESGYGGDVGNPAAVQAIRDNPMLQKTGRKDINGNEMLANDLFRVVHDFFGHLKEGYGFRAAGEDNAWRTHANMYSDAAKPAVTAETRGQNSWLNYGPHGEKNRTAKTEDTIFADQKIGVMPEWVWKDEMPPAAPAVAKGRSRFVDDSGMAIPGREYTKEAQRINREIAASPKGEGPLDLSKQGQVPDVEQRPLERYAPPRGISTRMQDALENPDVRSGMEESMRKGAGVEQWYHTEPIRQAFVEQLGPEDGAAAFKRYMDQVAATSPRSDVPTNIRNASYYYAGGDPKKKNPYPYGHVAQNLHKQNIENLAEFGGWDVFQNPKPASFAENLRGNLEPVTVDTHAFRNIAMRTKDPRFLETSFTQKLDRESAGEGSLVNRYADVKTDGKGQKIATFRPQQLVKEGRISLDEAQKIPSFWASKPKDNEYAAAENLFREVGNRVGMRPADAQAAAWAGAGDMTGLGTVGTHTFNELMNERIMFTAKMRGEKPEKVLRDFITGKKPLLSDTSTGVAFGALDGGRDR